MAPSRDPWLDNAKTVLVVLVVVGHSLVLLPSGGWTRDHLYDFIYYWHMPAFVLVSGYLSKGFRYTPRRLWQLVTTLAVPYVIFSWLMAMWRIHVTHELDHFHTIWFNPHWPMWYLCAMIMWRLATPLLRLHPGMIVVAVAVSLVAKLWNVELFDINRTLGFLPFFTIGLHLHGRPLALVRSRWSRVPALVYFVLLAVVVVPRTSDWWSTSWTFYRDTYAAHGASAQTGVWNQFWLVLLGLGGALSALALVPRRATFLTPMGAWTMVVYLCHGFPIRWLHEWPYDAHLPFPATGTLAVVVTVALAVGWGLLLAWPPVATRLDYAVDPVNTIPRALWRSPGRRVS